MARRKAGPAQVRRACIYVAITDLYIGDYVEDAKSHVPYYINMCKEYEKGDKKGKRDLKQALIMTIIRMAEINLEKREKEQKRVIDKALNLFDFLTGVTNTRQS